VLKGIGHLVVEKKTFNSRAWKKSPRALTIPAVRSRASLSAPREERALDLSARSVWQGALHLAAVALLVSTALAAVHDASQAWDVWYYHMPFAARLAGIVGPEAYLFHPSNEARFAGFPLLGELLQGLVWRLSGRPEAANLVAFASIPLFALFLRKKFGVPAHLSVLALFAIPLVHVHATSSYVDLPANAALAVLVLVAIQAWAQAEPPAARALVLAGVCAAIAVNTKTLLQPLVILALLAILARALPHLVRTRAKATLAVVVFALPFVFATPLKNLASHHNPWYPVEVRVAGHVFPGPDGPYHSSPEWLARAAQPVRFAASVLELGVRPLTDRRRWTVDQWTPHDHDGYRMGGYFGAYVVVLLALFASRFMRERAREVRAAGIGFAAFTAVVAWMPQSHELRYYMAWMIVLVALNLWLACRPGARAESVSIVTVIALAVVLVVTRGSYVWPTGSTFAELVHDKTSEELLSRVRDGDRICVDRPPFTFLWAAPFHGSRRYTVEETDSGCAGRPALE
jgi:hypothetical protein